MPAQLEEVGSVVYGDSVSRTFSIGMSKPTRSVYVLADLSTVVTTGSEMASVAEMIDFIRLSHGSHKVEVRGTELYNIGIGHYGEVSQCGPPLINAPVAYGDYGAVTKTWRQSFRIPCGAPAGPGKLDVQISFTGAATFAETAANCATTGTIYFLADTAPSEYIYDSWTARTINIGTTRTEFIPPNLGTYLLAVGVVVRNDVTAWTAAAEVADLAQNRSTNYLDNLGVFELKNVEQVYRLNAPQAFLLHTGRLIGQGLGGHLQATVVAGSISASNGLQYPSGHYWAPLDAQETSSNLRIYLAGTATSADDMDLSVWYGTPSPQGSSEEQKDPNAPTPGAPGKDVPVGQPNSSAKTSSQRLERYGAKVPRR